MSGFKKLLRQLPVIGWLVAWFNPLHLARRLLRAALEENAQFARGRLLDIGCGDRPYREMFPDVQHYLGLDIPSNPRADLWADGMRLPFLGESFDTVLCNQVLEHVPEPSSLMEEAARVLRPGGHLILTTPQTWGLHSEPHDYYRYTLYGLLYLAQKSGLKVITVRPTCGLWATLAQRVADTMVHQLGVRWPRWLVWLLRLVLAPLLLLGWALDGVFGHKGDTLDNILVAEKQSASTSHESISR